MLAAPYSRRYALRWKFYPKLLEFKFPELAESLDAWKKRETIWVALKYSYLPWILSHFVLLCIHPFSPVSHWETLFDWVAGADPSNRTDSFVSWATKVAMYCCGHGFLATQGLLAASLAFKYQLVHFTWILCVFFSVCFSGWRFYETAINPKEGADLSGAMPMQVSPPSLPFRPSANPGLTQEGFVRSGIAW